MGSSNISLYIAACASLVFLFAWRLQSRSSATKDPEPACIAAPIPLPTLGHIWGLLRHKSAYWVNLSKRSNLPIFSISMFGRKTYVVSSPSLMHPIQRQYRALSVWYMEAFFTAKLSANSREATEKILDNLGPGSEGPALFVEGLKLVQHSMSIQGGVEDMNRAAAQLTKTRLDELREAGGAKGVDLWAWMQHEMTLIMTEAVYGPANPYRDPRVESGFWDFTNDTINLLMPGLLKPLMARKGLAGRAYVVDKFYDYFFSTRGHETASALTKARYAALVGKIPDVDVARLECTNCIAILSNTVPTAFWTAYHVFSDPGVLAEVRAQVEAISASVSDDETGEEHGKRRVRKIPLSKLKDDAPLLFSTMQEALRYRGTGTGPRMLMADTVISVGDAQYQLKKDCALIVANKALHFDKEAWGPDADQFVADRFCRGGKTPGHAFRGFGGGVNLCPGKGFVMTEIAALLAMLVMRFDVVPREGRWEEPGQDLSNMAIQMSPPRGRMLVDLVPREGAGAGERWDFTS